MLVTLLHPLHRTESRRTATSVIIATGVLMIGNGLLGSLLGVRAKAEGFSTGLMGAANATYYLGFLFGTPLSVRLLHRLPRKICFTVFVLSLALAALMYGVLVSGPAWIGLRLLTGLSLGGMYVVVESWLNDLASNATRGRLIAAYVAVVSGGIGLGQLLLNVASITSVTPFVIAAGGTAVATLIVIRVPATRALITEESHVSILEVLRLVPSGAIAMMLVGLSQSAILTMTPVWATRAGLSSHDVAKAMIAITLGIVVFQVPAGVIADRMSRRLLFVALAIGGGLSCVALLQTTPGSLLSLGAFTLLGGLNTPLYALANAYTNDWLPADKVVAASSVLLNLYALGAITGPLVTASWMNLVGSHGFFWALLAVHGVLAAFMTVRIIVAPDHLATT